ncbi:hypothetical protein [Clostridium transplantifaecale]|uniref:hypothetical protein n=1 Tax=Clostridium transplantifaecale TaxID=2479838 RepID=UPI000F6323C8|nr:hypothetical protein [Clostridium transplantifaecale]
MREENYKGQKDAIMDIVKTMPYGQKEKLLTEIAEEISHFPSQTSKKASGSLSEQECNVILSRIAGELGMSDASKLPYTSFLSSRH